MIGGCRQEKFPADEHMPYLNFDTGMGLPVEERFE